MAKNKRRKRPRIEPPHPGAPVPPQAGPSAVATLQLPDAPPPPQAALPLLLARRKLALGNALDFLFRLLPGTSDGRDLAEGEPGTLTGRALAVLQGEFSWGSSLLDVARWVWTTLGAGRWAQSPPAPGDTGASTADALPAAVKRNTETPNKRPLEEPPQEPAHEKMKGRLEEHPQDRVKNQAWLDRGRPRQVKSVAAAPPPPMIVDGEVVPHETVDQYANYCSIARLKCPAKSSVCHICMFEMERSPNCIVPTSHMILHCEKMHKGESIVCSEAGCTVKVRTSRELSLHIHFCHRLPSEWWQQ